MAPLGGERLARVLREMLRAGGVVRAG
jgi:hypothetical protein